MTGLKSSAILWSARLGLPRLVQRGREPRLTTILVHHFRFGDEGWPAARERLRRQLDFVASQYHPVALDKALDADAGATGSEKPPLLFTIDDAKRELLEVFDLFESFGIPVAQFVCAGWSARATPERDPAAVKLRLVSNLHFYDGPAETLRLGTRKHTLDRNGNTALIDTIIGADSTADLDALDALDRRLHDPNRDNSVCDIAELRDLQQAGMTIGCHSVSHPRIALQSPRRKAFEIASAKSYLEAHLGPMRHFAYPYGTSDSHDGETRTILRDQGFVAGFTTRPAQSGPDTDRLVLPRIAMPETALPDAEFKARVLGGAIPLNMIRERLW